LDAPVTRTVDRMALVRLSSVVGATEPLCVTPFVAAALHERWMLRCVKDAGTREASMPRAPVALCTAVRHPARPSPPLAQEQGGADAC
jgi:hypothetical protein